MIGAGIACIGMGGAGVGVGTIFGHYLAAALRNPSAAQGQFGNLIFGFAVTEALGIFSLLIALLLLFALRSEGRKRGTRASPMARKARAPRDEYFRRRNTARTFRRSSRRPLRPSSSGWCWSSRVLYLLMSRLALPRIGAIMDARRQSVEGDLAEAKRLQGRIRRRHRRL